MKMEESVMNKIIGGLLVATLLARPALLKVDFIAYEIYKAQTQLLAVVRGMEEQELHIIVEKDIDEILTDIDQNKRQIHRLLKDKNNVYGQIQTVMQLKAVSRTSLSEEQIVVYKRYVECYTNERQLLADTLSEVNERLDITVDIAKHDIDYSFVYKKLKAVSDSQYDAICNLNSIIDMSQRTLAYIG